MSRRPSPVASRASRGGEAAALPSPWVVGPRYDQLFLVGAWLVPLLLVALAEALPWGLLAALAVFVLLDNSHQVATLPLTVFDPATMQRARLAYLGGAAAIAAAAATVSFFPGSLAAQAWASLVVYWGAWHIIRQHYGFLRLYQARDKPASPLAAKAEAWALYAGASFPYFLNLSQGWASADPIGSMLYRVPVPWWSPWVVLAVFAGALGVVLFDAMKRAGTGGRFANLRLLHLVLVVSNFWIGLLGVGRENLIVAVLFITSYHDLQYHGILWHVGTRRARNPGEPVAPWVRRLFSSAMVFAVAMTAGALAQALLRNDFQLAAMVLPASAATTAMFAVVNSYAYMHYWFDGMMWKLSRDARLRAELGLGGS